MDVFVSIEKWFARFKPYFFTYKNGFLQMPYLTNSPQVMVEGFKKIPFVKYNAEKQSISVKTLFLNVTFYWREIEDELFIICSETKFKANITFRHYFDESLPADYYTLSLCIDHHSKAINSVVNNAGFPDDSWLLFKPGAKVSHHHFKGTTGRYITVFFTGDWLKNYLQHIHKKVSKEWMALLQSDSDHLICPHLPGNVMYNEENLFKLFFSKDQFKGESYQEELKREALNLIACFTGKMQSENINEKHFLVSNLERIQVLQAEQFLKDHLYEKFPGIGSVANKVGMSETKLKESFKTVYNKTLFQYFQSLQMEKAKELILDSDANITQVATTLCYENTSKFAAAFKDYHGYLPSKTKQEAE
jgi:AraC-like DNA-binding protein